MIVITENIIGYNHSFVLTDEFRELNIFKKILIILTCGNIYAKSKYYGALKAVEIAIICCGLNYDDDK